MGKSADTVPRVVERYVAAQAARNFDTLVELFTDDAVVIDEGKTWRGKQEIRAWREGVASTYQYTTELQGVDGPNRGRYVARIRLEGNFPGGVVDLRYRFTVDNEQIRRLEIGT